MAVIGGLGHPLFSDAVRSAVDEATKDLVYPAAPAARYTDVIRHPDGRILMVRDSIEGTFDMSTHDKQAPTIIQHVSGPGSDWGAPDPNIARLPMVRDAKGWPYYWDGICFVDPRGLKVVASQEVQTAMWKLLADPTAARCDTSKGPQASATPAYQAAASGPPVGFPFSGDDAVIARAFRDVVMNEGSAGAGACDDGLDALMKTTPPPTLGMQVGQTATGRVWPDKQPPSTVHQHMANLISDRVIALINSQPRSPTKDEIAAAVPDVIAGFEAGCDFQLVSRESMANAAINRQMIMPGAVIGFDPASGPDRTAFSTLHGTPDGGVKIGHHCVTDGDVTADTCCEVCGTSYARWADVKCRDPFSRAAAIEQQRKAQDAQLAAYKQAHAAQWWSSLARTLKRPGPTI